MSTEAKAQSSAASAAARPPDELGSGIFALLFGLFLGLSLLKFGNPVILENLVESPANLLEGLMNSWPIAWGHWLLGGVAVVGFCTARRCKDAPWPVVALPMIWLVWQFLAGMRTLDTTLTGATVAHFASCVVCFYLGFFALGRSRNPVLFWPGLLAGLGLVMVFGFQQHFGGLEETRRYFFLYIYPQMKHISPEYLKKMSTNRIFATLFYPNALAGVVLLLLPIALGVVWSWHRQFTTGARRFLMAALAAAALACLYWSGSKGGWLLMLLLLFVATLFLPFNRQLKIILVTAVIILGLAGFFWKYSGFFKKGATSVVARFDYWRAAVQTVHAQPVFGTGPGTFGLAYAKVKRPESEMSRLTHNDYLQQASDSGLPGLVFYAGFVICMLFITYRRSGLRDDWVKLAVWLGLLGWALQSLVEFDLYIPALAWPAFGLSGWLLAQAPNQIDSRPPVG